MKPLLIITVIASCVLAFAFRHVTNPVYITGHLKDNPDKFPKGFYPFAKVFAKKGKKVVGKTTADSSGDFELVFTPNLKDTFDIYCTPLGREPILLTTITDFDTDNPEMTFHLPVVPTTDLSGKVICPRCKKADNVYLIEYGNYVEVSHIKKNGKRIIDTFYNGTYPEIYCVVGAATYFCHRDKVKF
jgi:hypothetical protein